jgi:hypothetical protein
LLIAEPRILLRIGYARTWRTADATRAHKHLPQRTRHAGAVASQQEHEQPHHAMQQAKTVMPQPTFAAIDTPLAIGDRVEDAPW